MLEINSALFLLWIVGSYHLRLSEGDATTPVSTQRSAYMFRGRRMSHGGSVFRDGVRRGSNTTTRQSEVKVLAGTYVVRTREEGDATDVVTIIFLLCSAPIYALIDPESSHSYINSKLVKSGSLKSEISKVSMVCQAL